jgi:hypothetical protein
MCEVCEMLVAGVQRDGAIAVTRRLSDESFQVLRVLADLRKFRGDQIGNHLRTLTGVRDPLLSYDKVRCRAVPVYDEVRFIFAHGGYKIACIDIDVSTVGPNPVVGPIDSCIEAALIPDTGVGLRADEILRISLGHRYRLLVGMKYAIGKGWVRTPPIVQVCDRDLNERGHFHDLLLCE